MRSLSTRTVAGAALLFLALPISPASAHAAYKDSSPANKSTVSVPPSEVWAEFTEPPAQSSKLEIYDPCGERVDSGSATIMAYRITTTMSSDRGGTYTARFYVTSDLDSHVTTGSFTFTSTSGSPCPGSGPSENQEDSDEDATGGGGDTPRATGTDEGSAAQEFGGASATGGNRGDGRKGKHAGMKHGPGREKEEKEEGLAKSENRSQASGPPLEEEAPEPVPPGMPMDWLMISFGIAAAVGAAGGKVYAGLMGAPKT